MAPGTTWRFAAGVGNCAVARAPHAVLIGIGLLTSGQARRRLEAVANEIRGDADADFIVGPSAPPHVTLLHAYFHEGQEREWWHRCHTALTPILLSEVLEIAISHIPVGDVHSPRGGTYVGLNLVRSDELAKAHSRVVAEAAAIGARPRGLFGSRYHPHVTLTVLRTVPQITQALARSITGLTFGAELVLAAIGPHGSFARILCPGETRQQ